MTLIWKITLSLTIITGLASFHQRTNICTADKLHGEWTLINMYPYRLTKVDTLNKESSKSRFGTQTCTFTKSGTYKDNQGDYETNGKYIIDTKKCLLKKFDRNRKKTDTLVFEITYLDSSYMLYTEFEKERTWFYKKKQ
jgi:hypothetical protein